ncbi:MAG: hypothetical protein FJW30_02205 [Acidobacteria bacterium]|nr:hypothetical protein [Acidobacteriota bacterium]
MATPEDELRSALVPGRAVLVVGTGVSIAASGGHKQASWVGLLRHGLEWLREHNLYPKAELLLTFLEDAPETHWLISTAQTVRSKMSDEQFANWLKETVGSIQATKPAVLDALEALRRQGYTLATTNYDGLLLRGGVTPITWKDTDEILGAQRQGDTGKVVFLHGYWRRPETVILDWRSYDRIARDGAYREDLAAFWKTNVWVYVGCGTSGITDPDFGLLLETHGGRARQANHWDFCLVRESQREEFQAEFDRRGFNIKAVSFGQKHDDLPKFLRSLVRVQTPPAAPAREPFVAVPDYIGSHAFIGRAAQLEELNDWAKPADPANLLIFDAIGGTGKSMLTWHWATQQAPSVRTDWAGRFWYSFYERGAVMADFCRHALAYMTGTDWKEWAERPSAELFQKLVEKLHAEPWLLVLDGLERVLVAYHRIDAAEVPDEDVNQPTDKILERNPCNTIREEDGALLRLLAGAKPSKVLISSRLIPRVLLNQAGQPIAGARRITLPGLRPADAEALLRSCGVTGDSAKMQAFLTENCDNHPLVTGVVAGLVANYLPRRGDFDAWLANDGARLNLAELDLIQRRNNILHAALDGLSPHSRRLLSILALLSGSVDYETLAALAQADIKLAIRDLELRGMVQYDHASRRWDLHPVVRRVASGGMDSGDKEQYGQRVVDHFSAQPHPPYDEAKTLEDVAPGIYVVQTLLKLGKFQAAADVYWRGLSNALLFNLEAYVEVLALLKPYFPAGWEQPPDTVESGDAAYLANGAAIALRRLGEQEMALKVYGALVRIDLRAQNWSVLCLRLSNAAVTRAPAAALRLFELIFDVAQLTENREWLYLNHLYTFDEFSRIGNWQEAERHWEALSSLPIPYSRAIYRPGDTEWYFAWHQLRRGQLRPEDIDKAETLARAGDNRFALRKLAELRGHWQLELGNWHAAVQGFETAVAMARERRLLDGPSECGLALARFLDGQLSQEEARAEALRLAQQSYSSYFIARLWQAIGDLDKAKRYALIAYEFYWGDGEPSVNRCYLNKTIKLLNELSVPIPNLPPYDPAKDPPLDWEAEVRAAIEKLRAEMRQ